MLCVFVRSVKCTALTCVFHFTLHRLPRSILLSVSPARLSRSQTNQLSDFIPSGLPLVSQPGQEGSDPTRRHPFLYWTHCCHIKAQICTVAGLKFPSVPLLCAPSPTPLRTNATAEWLFVLSTMAWVRLLGWYRRRNLIRLIKNQATEEEKTWLKHLRLSEVFLDSQPTFIKSRLVVVSQKKKPLKLLGRDSSSSFRL